MITLEGAQKVSHLLKTPTEAVDDHLVDLVVLLTSFAILSLLFFMVTDILYALFQIRKQLIAFSIHPPLAVQRPIDDLNPSDITTSRDSALFKVKMMGNLAWEKMRGVQRSNLIRSALGRGDITAAGVYVAKAQSALAVKQKEAQVEATGNQK